MGDERKEFHVTKQARAIQAQLKANHLEPAKSLRLMMVSAKPFRTKQHEWQSNLSAARIWAPKSAFPIGALACMETLSVVVALATYVDGGKCYPFRLLRASKRRSKTFADTLMRSETGQYTLPARWLTTAEEKGAAAAS
jgi:hypothetical protein